MLLFIFLICLEHEYCDSFSYFKFFSVLLSSSFSSQKWQFWYLAGPFLVLALVGQLKVLQHLLSTKSEKGINKMFTKHITHWQNNFWEHITHWQIKGPWTSSSSRCRATLSFPHRGILPCSLLCSSVDPCTSMNINELYFASLTFNDLHRRQ